MLIRKYKTTDCNEMVKLFFDTVHNVNCDDYTKEQLDVWANGKFDLQAWDNSFNKNHTIVVIRNDEIVGFGDIDKTGYLDRLYIHKDYQREGIGKAICDNLETEFNFDKIVVHASITALGFFENRGYKIVKKQKLDKGGVILINYIMEKYCD